jgi:hypothetical protein
MLEELAFFAAEPRAGRRPLKYSGRTDE